MRKALTLEQLIEKEYFIVCPFLTTGEFILFCSERTINTSKEQLEEFERLGIFFPIARVALPKIEIKEENIENEKQSRHLDELKGIEKLSWDISEEYDCFEMEKSCMEKWFKNGFLWDPSTRDFEGRNLFYDEKKLQYKENYYSRFQCYSLYNLLRSTKREFHAELYYSFDEKKVKENVNQIVTWAKNVIDTQKDKNTVDEIIPFVCQVLSNRFFPKTQSDRRTIDPSDYFNWNWKKYCRNWDSKSVIRDLSISVDELKNYHQKISTAAQIVDPLEHWYELINFVSVEKKKQLKGNALLAQTLYSMEQMMRLFYEDVTSKKLFPPNEDSTFRSENYYGKGVIENNLKYLELLTNQYHLNPRPKLILVVEGNGEKEQFPRLSKEFFGYPFSKLGIEVVNLEGIGEFTGEKRRDRYGALEKFIDYHHNWQTIVFIVLDNEGRATNIKNKLLNATSKFNKKRHVTKTEYIVIWEKKTIEFENFDNNEIAKALTAVSNNQFEFKESEIENCRLLSRKKDADQLSILFKDKTGFGLSKPELLKMLFGFIIDNGKKEFSVDGKPIRSVCKVIKQIIELSSLNHQPSRLDSWEKNQESGYFGVIKQKK